ncbi:MAG: hypothetical protein JAY75_07095 [Candidatus Thiodiazotropha taylori]|nr:hypothetical protein [Candidatus Thiodiazotropha taylori]MCW4307977.1 hypothetical protein [Candidatus Thiodiazotropha endolucinida]
MALEKSHESFMLVHKNLRKAKERQAKIANRKSKDIDYQVGDPVFYKNNTRSSKLESRYHPYYRIIRKTGEHNYEIRSQLGGNVRRVHSDNLRPANIDEWVIPKSPDGKPKRRAAYVVPPPEADSSSESSSDDERKQSDEHLKPRRDTEGSSSDTDPDDNIPLTVLARKLRREKAHLASRNQGDEPMEIDSVNLSPVLQHSVSNSDQNSKIKTLLQAVADLM